MICNFLVIRLGSLWWNSVSRGDFHFARRSDVTITLTSITLSGCTKFEKNLLRGFGTIITLFPFEVILSGGELGARLIELERRGSPSHTRFWIETPSIVVRPIGI